QEKVGAAAGVHEAAELTRRAVQCDLPDAMAAALTRVQALAVDDADFVGIAGAAFDLAELAHRRDVRDFDRAPLRPLVAQLFLRAVLMAPEAARCSSDAAGPVGKALSSVQWVVQLGDDTTADV